MRVKKDKLDSRTQKYCEEAERFIVKVYDEKGNLLDIADTNICMLVANCEDRLKTMLLGKVDKDDCMTLAKICIGAKHMTSAIEKEYPVIKLLTKLGQMAIKEEEQS